MSFDTALRKAAKVVLDSFGKQVKVRVITLGAYNTATGSASDTPTDTTLNGRLDEYMAHELDDRVLRGDRKLTVAALDLSVAPTPKDKVVIGTAVYDVVNVETHLAKDLAAIYVLQIRGAA